VIVQRSALDSMLLDNVCDVRFVRRDPRSGDGATRRMLCTKSYDILNSVNGRTTLNYRPPKGPKKINEAADNLLVVWDILMQNYRTINCNQVDLIKEIPASEFWPYFNENIYPMSAEQKAGYINS
tara:strand:+ start:111 stop:485 length:375 start_codon:yes stop_codon:yes gene_type:complete